MTLLDLTGFDLTCCPYFAFFYLVCMYIDIRMVHTKNFSRAPLQRLMDTVVQLKESSFAVE